jgi:hypothetical protein
MSEKEAAIQLPTHISPFSSSAASLLMQPIRRHNVKESGQQPVHLNAIMAAILPHRSALCKSLFSLSMLISFRLETGLGI